MLQISGVGSGPSPTCINSVLVLSFSFSATKIVRASLRLSSGIRTGWCHLHTPNLRVKTTYLRQKTRQGFTSKPSMSWGESVMELKRFGAATHTCLTPLFAGTQSIPFTLTQLSASSYNGWNNAMILLEVGLLEHWVSPIVKCGRAKCSLQIDENKIKMAILPEFPGFFNHQTKG